LSPYCIFNKRDTLVHTAQSTKLSDAPKELPGRDRPFYETML
jgi:hypothetical protein